MAKNTDKLAKNKILVVNETRYGGMHMRKPTQVFLSHTMYNL